RTPRGGPHGAPPRARHSAQERDARLVHPLRGAAGRIARRDRCPRGGDADARDYPRSGARGGARGARGLRFRGDLLARQGAGAAPVEAAYRGAIELARRQSARSYELRAATSLGRWLVSHCRAGDARDAVAPLYASFAEGFDTKDLIEAKAL